MTEVTAVIARGIGKPDLRYEQFSYDQVQQVLTQKGISPKEAALYIEMYKAVTQESSFRRSRVRRRTRHRLRLKHFIRDVFAPAYHEKARTA